VNRLVAYIGNDPDHLSCALYPGRHALHVFSAGSAADWGLGFVQGGDVLLQKRSRSSTAQVDFFDLASDLRADALLGRATQGEDERARAASADPFRFRYWLFGAVGEFGDFSQIQGRLLDSIPEFLRRNIRGPSPSEQIFHLFLAFLHDAGLLESLSAEPKPAHRALDESLAFVDRLLAASGAASTKLAVIATDGRCLVALSHGHPVQYLEIRGIPACPVCRDKRADDETRDRGVAHDQLKAVILEADHQADQRTGWRQVPDGGALLVGPHVSVQTVSTR
jgi:glutamine amidotransferase